MPWWIGNDDGGIVLYVADRNVQVAEYAGAVNCTLPITQEPVCCVRPVPQSVPKD